MELLPAFLENSLNSRRKRSMRLIPSRSGRAPVQRLSALGLTATALACQLLPTPAKAYQVFFNAPNVLGGIRGVAIAMPSTGETNFYDVIFKKGTLAEVYGDPPSLDLDNANDAQTIMERSASAINGYLAANVGVPLYFGVTGEEGYVLPFGSPYIDSSGARLIGVSISVPHCMVGFYWDPVSMSCRLNTNYDIRVAPQITASLGEVPILQSSVWADLQRSAAPVPGPLPLAGAWVGLRWARRLRRLTHQGRGGIDPIA
jgi:hypothetical protein